jgi:hypothetical protein
MAKTVIAPSKVKQAGLATNGHVAGHVTGHRLPSVSARPDAPDDGRYVTKEEYWANYYTHADASYEWNNGYLEAKPVSTLMQYRLFLWFLKLLHEYVTYYDNAELMSLETGFTMTVPDPDKGGALKEVVRKPDLAAILRTPTPRRSCVTSRSRRVNTPLPVCRSITSSTPKINTWFSTSARLPAIM